MYLAYMEEDLILVTWDGCGHFGEHGISKTFIYSGLWVFWPQVISETRHMEGCGSGSP